MQQTDDILLLKLIKRGDQIAFQHLFYEYVDSLERFIMYYIHDREKAQELVLDIFTYAFIPTEPSAAWPKTRIATVATVASTSPASRSCGTDV